jgi:hypothetical protein
MAEHLESGEKRAGAAYCFVLSSPISTSRLSRLRSVLFRHAEAARDFPAFILSAATLRQGFQNTATACQYADKMS